MVNNFNCDFSWPSCECKQVIFSNQTDRMLMPKPVKIELNSAQGSGTQYLSIAGKLAVFF
jgi:hypothetical protein